MSSVLTNISAMSALQKLHSVNRNLERSQDRISSGLRVADASDNAAYWSIAKTMLSDNSSLSAVSDAIGLGIAKVDIAKAALEKSIEVISNIKNKLVAATEEGTDAGSVQEEITQLQAQLRDIARGASFNGENWLQANIGSPSGFVTKSVVGSFIRENTGAISVRNIDYDLESDSVLFDTVQGDKHYGILDRKAILSDLEPKIADVTVNYQNSKGKTSSESMALVTVDGAWLQSKKATFNQELGIARYSPSGNTSSSHGSGGNSFAADPNAIVYVLVADDVWVRATKNKPTSTKDDSFSIIPFVQEGTENYYIDTSKKSIETKPDNAKKDEINDNKIELGYSVTTLNITEHKNTDMYTKTTAIKKMVEFVDRQLRATTVAAGKLGSISSRIQLQEDFVKFMRDSIEKGVGRLIDADMEAESSKFAALQTQQQLALQALSIVNNSSQKILSLFRG
ncbi:flagellin [Candidatus Liberibacter sp.]|uniref:flagellin N-terminal helical domain-containing protein n=1 Tax=Candidatus Liberibacter sp. TaxID=34022 RepID=UPI0015F60B09|nr:flagellin [Candidatus Liberibacter sp.]MBA5724077.1 flagellin [Candidatus Liberibacter sp.]